MLKPHGLSQYSQACLELPRSQVSPPTNIGQSLHTAPSPLKYPRHLPAQFLFLGYLPCKNGERIDYNQRWTSDSPYMWRLLELPLERR